jgi:phosphatidylserine/phosphatidylglycerophosphate/cardiolipin synthase-like enzyme
VAHHPDEHRARAAGISAPRPDSSSVQDRSPARTTGRVTESIDGIGRPGGATGGAARCVVGVVVGGVELYAGPQVLGAPDDLDLVIRDFVAGARKSLLVAVQELDSRAVAEALLAAKARKIRVSVLLEGNYLVEDKAPADPWLGAGANEENRVIHAALLRAGVDVVTDLNPALFHQKFVVRDADAADGGAPAVLTGSANFTLTDTGKNPVLVHGAGPQVGNNLNHVVVLRGKQIAELYRAEFARLRSGTFGELHERVEPKPRELTLGRMRIKPLFAPRHGPEMEIMKQMLKASERIDFAMFTFARSSGIDDAMFRLAGSLPIRGVLDRGQGVQKWAATQDLLARGVELRQNKAGTGVRKVHHKLMVVDRRLTIVGSFNYTATANMLNDENIIVIGDLEETNPDAEAAQRAVAGYALAEIDRIISDLSEPI